MIWISMGAKCMLEVQAKGLLAIDVVVIAFSGTFQVPLLKEKAKRLLLWKKLTRPLSTSKLSGNENGSKRVGKNDDF